ncbi:MAG TPA: DUF4350 domain-containing protein [Sphingomicrobium sp.]|nr:DUF4350 domain-containing protein [Sphingomicrobium sp.]
MTNGRWRAALAAAAILLLFAGAVVFALTKSSPPMPPERPAAERPELMLLTTLPIVFAERLTLDAPPSAALEALQSRYRVVPISVAASSDLGAGNLLLMAQPQAQPAEALVELDAWVRNGGRVLLLADPALEWPSERPLGDLLRAPTSFADTGLLTHWGLRIEAPQASGPASRDVEGRELRTASPGRLTAIRPACAAAANGVLARCRIGRGEATVIADADFLNVDAMKAADRSNLAVLLDELARLEQ